MTMMDRMRAPMVTILKRRLSDQIGQALPLVLITLAMGSLLIGGFLSHTSTNLIASRVFGQSLPAQYAADAGIEDAIWNLMYGDLVLLTEPEDGASYSVTEPVNGITPHLTVTRLEPTPDSTIATDDFESGEWSGGSGWLSGWYHEGDASIKKGENPHEGKYHLSLRADTGYVRRAADPLEETSVYLIFWAKAESFEAGETAECLVSSNSENWTTLRTWADGADDNTYHYYQIDLSDYATSSQLWIAFEANMSKKDDKFYVDDLRIVAMIRPIDYEIVSTAAEVTIRAGVAIEGSQRTVVSWEIE
ncbi:hypothetical protein ES703_45632 [subsurface metagenome]